METTAPRLSLTPPGLSAVPDDGTGAPVPVPDVATVDEALAAAPGWRPPHPGQGRTRALWEALATLAAGDLGVVRALEPHLDALAILDQARTAGHDAGLPDDPASTWGVFAAEGPGVRLVATPADDGDGGGAWRLDGTKPWCSLADRLDRALVTAHVDDRGGRRLFAVDLRHPGVRAGGGRWVARGLAEIPSTPLVLDAIPAVPVGPAGWYLERPGFWWGGIGVAACWYGGLVGVARAVHAGAARRPDAPLLALHLGRADAAVQAARRALAEAAALVDAHVLDGAAGALLALRVRGTVARAADDVLATAAHALGPAPLAHDEEHAKRVADLELYVRQEHAERDAAALGAALAAGDPPW